MPRLAERLRSRFEWGLIVDINPPNYDTRLSILRAKAELCDAGITADALEYIAGLLRRNIRELEGGLNRVVAYARLLRTAPTAELAAKALKNLVGPKTADRQNTPDALIEAVARCFNTTPQDLTGQKRSKEIATARRLAMYLLRHETGCSLSQIGKLLGGRDASAVTGACKKIDTDLKDSTYLQKKLKQITNIGAV